MVDARGRVMTQADTSEKYKNEIIDFSKAGKKKEKNATVYSYQLGTVGKINLMVLPGGGILENVLIMQIAFVVQLGFLFGKLFFVDCNFQSLYFPQQFLEFAAHRLQL